MDRRAYLGLLTGATLSFAGCTEGNARPPVAGFPTPGNPDPIVKEGFPTTVCSNPPYLSDGIHAVVEPAVGPDWEDVTVPEEYRFADETGRGLSADTYVVGVEYNGAARAYPLSILWWHEVVNDTLGGDPVLVTYCAMCETGMVAERRVGGEETTFRVSGQLWQAPQPYSYASAEEGRVFGASVVTGEVEFRNAANLVLLDEATGSYWSQILARGICGPMSGERMRIMPSSVATWAEWRADYPDTDVLLPPPQSKTA
ncbi:DUF3179 domain-containing protein [Haloferax sp. MBLA0076]|uniref:DUF3179 domain-containing protein n=1 Tax=Haloferax litoreum TaxID=2666140 RepID=A0A6A8GGN9_9EURY|nr:MULTISPECIES: DUF3179 domain-containing (seleno)protein [Haloferax]KAB1193156.1 DUF3179 domain-containing protein [Haloferax sp. CBA1148]MRX21652.1 DUF3179 domain-containing protein [Haloferax litoreum]